MGHCSPTDPLEAFRGARQEAASGDSRTIQEGRNKKVCACAGNLCENVELLKVTIGLALRAYEGYGDPEPAIEALNKIKGLIKY